MPDPQRWPRRRFWLAVAVVFGAQVALLFVLSYHSSGPPPPSVAARALRLRPVVSGELLLLEDPTLFALPRERDPASSTLRQAPGPEFPLESRTDPPRWLPLDGEKFGAAFASFAQTNASPSFEVVIIPEPAMTFPELPPLTPVIAASTMRIEGPLARRRLLTPPILRAWPNADLLTNTVVNLVVNSEGLIEFAQLSPRGSGSEVADQSALQCARSLRFQPLPRRGSEPPGIRRREVTVGTAIFAWQTLPLTNATPANGE